MNYFATIKLIFPVATEVLFTELINLNRYQLWNSGLISVSPKIIMKQGLRYKTQSLGVGRVNEAVVVVEQLIKNRALVLTSDSGIISFKTSYVFRETALGTSELTCNLSFDLKRVTLKFAQPVIESMAKARIKGDLETLKALIEHHPTNLAQ